MATAKTPTPIVTPDDVLALVRALVQSHDGRAYSTQQYHLAELLRAGRLLAPDLRWEPIAPADEVRRPGREDGAGV